MSSCDEKDGLLKEPATTYNESNNRIVCKLLEIPEVITCSLNEKHFRTMGKRVFLGSLENRKQESLRYHSFSASLVLPPVYFQHLINRKMVNYAKDQRIKELL